MFHQTEIRWEVTLMRGCLINTDISTKNTYNYLIRFFRFHFENFDQMSTIKTKMQEDEELLFSCDSEVESPSTTFKID